MTAIIGCNESKDLFDLLQERNIRYRYLEGTYSYENGTSEIKTFAEIYDIDKETALNIAKKLNQELIIWQGQVLNIDGQQYDENYLKDKIKGKKITFKLESIKPSTTNSIKALGGYKEIKELIGEWNSE